MKKFMKILAVVLALAMTAALSVSLTLAYLTDQEEAVNVMTLGNVSIKQHELQRKDGVDYKNGGQIADGDELEAFEQGQLLFPSTYTNISDYSAKGPNEEQFWWGPYVTADVSGNGSSNGLWDDKLTGAMDKFVFVENTGKSDAYYRTVIAFECPEGMEYGDNSDKEFMMNVNLNSRFESEEVGYVTINGSRFLVLVMTYNKVLEPGTISRPSLMQVVMTHHATNEDMALLGDTYEILVVSQAVQVEGFADAQTALNTAFGEITTTNHPWAGEGKAPEIPVVAATADEVVEALNAGDDVVLTEDIEIAGTLNITEETEIDLNGHNLTVTALEAKENTTITGGTITHARTTYPALSVSSGTLTLNDVDIICNEPCHVTYNPAGTLSIAEYVGIEIWSGKCVLNDCTISVNCSEKRYGNTVFGVGIHEGEFTMNGGAIKVVSVGSHHANYEAQAAIFAGSDTNKVINLNNVSVDAKVFLEAWGGNTIINTTDAAGTWDGMCVSRHGGTYQINYNN